VVIGLDPGRCKCGVAALGTDGSIRARAIVPPDQVVAWIRGVARGRRALIAIGDGTGCDAVLAALESAGFASQKVDERDTSRQARQAYLREHPARGWRRLVPSGLRYPDGPYDDFVAVILARRRIEAGDCLTNAIDVC
jgi:hypothetical protein